MNKTKCDVCGEKHDKIHITCECSDCYIAGAKKEREKGRQDVLKKVEELEYAEYNDVEKRIDFLEKLKQEEEK